jgi:hypothetical protein
MTSARLSTVTCSFFFYVWISHDADGGLVNNFLLRPSERGGVAQLPLTPEENATLAVGAHFLNSGTGYMLEQGTKPGTISLVLMTNPLALLGW